MHPHRLKVCSISEMGTMRQNNEDVYLEMLEHAFFAIADGMGGHNAGEVAAREAIGSLAKTVHNFSTPLSPKPSIVSVQKAVCSANAWVHNLSLGKEELKGMGTTLSCFLIENEELLFAHVGDSRLYRFRKNLTQLTEDHSLRAQLIKQGKLKADEAHTFAQKNIVTRAVGTSREVMPDVGTTPIENGDLYMLCSDGLSDYLTDDEMEAIFKIEQELPITARSLVQASLAKGGRDNITLVLVKVY